MQMLGNKRMAQNVYESLIKPAAYHIMRISQIW